MANGKLNGKVALVTGANRGIGLEVTCQLAQQGATVILGARDLEKGKAAAATLRIENLQVMPQKLDAPAAFSQLRQVIHTNFGGCQRNGGIAAYPQ